MHIIALYLSVVNALIKKINKLEKVALLLEPGKDTRKSWHKQVSEIAENFLDKLENGKAYDQDSSHINLLKQPFTEEGMLSSKIFGDIVNYVDKPGINPASGGHLGYIPGGGLYASALADYWVNVTNRYAGISFANPGAVKIENELIRWMIRLVGYPETAWGNLASGGSIANLIAIVAAREAKGITPENIRKAVIYVSKQTHHSVEKAFRIAGLQYAITRTLPLDEKLKIDPVRFEEIAEDDKKQGLIPFLMVSTAGTTDAGVIDPIDVLSEICSRYAIWHHVDAAYGGFFLLAKSLSSSLEAINKSDSVVLDPHKGLFLPYGLGVVLVKSRTHLKNAFHYEANYMQDATEVETEISPAEVSPELTKHFRGLRMWLPLRLHGIKAFRSALEEKCLLTRYFYEKINKLNRFETFGKPELTVVMFRYIPVSHDPNAFNQLLADEIHRDGRIFISTTTINDVHWLRVAILVFRTHLKTIDLTLQLLAEKVILVENKISGC